MQNSASDSKAMKALNDGQSKVFIIMSVLLLIAFGANVAYSAVSIIFPPTVLVHGLGSGSVAWIIAGYPVAMMLFAGLVTTMLNKCGKKITLQTGVLCQAVSLILFGYCNNIGNDEINADPPKPLPAGTKYTYFACCVLCRMI
jgi:MFS family permease